MPTFSADVLTAFAFDLFQARGIPDDEANIVAKSLVTSNLSGHDSHGLIRIVQYAKAIEVGQLKPGTPLTTLHETAAVLVCDGGWNLGQVQAHRLLERLYPKAKDVGVAAGTLKQSGHIGRLGEYAETATKQGFAFFATVNNHGFGRAVAPPGGVAGRIGTNPLCLAVPTKADPVVLDIGTSVCAEGKVRVCYNAGIPAPEGWLLDAEGKPTTDPSVLYKDPRGTITPLGGSQAYKGFGIGLLLDMFVGGLAGGPCSRPEIGPQSANGVVFLLLDKDHFAGAEHFLGEVTTLSENVRNCPKAEATADILLPGDPERLARDRRAKDGIALDEGTWSQLVALADVLGVSVPGND